MVFNLFTESINLKVATIYRLVDLYVTMVHLQRLNFIVSITEEAWIGTEMQSVFCLHQSTPPSAGSISGSISTASQSKSPLVRVDQTLKQV